MKTYVTSILLILTGTLTYAEMQIDAPIRELQRIALKLYAEPEETCAEIIKEEESALNQALEQLTSFGYFMEEHTIKLLNLELRGSNLRAETIPFKLPPPNSFGFTMQTETQESAFLKPGSAPTGNRVWCTFHRQSIGKGNEKLGIAFYQTLHETYKNIGVYWRDETTSSIDNFISDLGLPDLGLTIALQMISAVVYRMNTGVPTLQQPIASLAALLSTYFLLTPYDFFSGLPLDKEFNLYLSEVRQEWLALGLAQAGAYYVNPTLFTQSDVTAIWLAYTLLGTLQSYDLWFFSNEKIEYFQQWIEENGYKLRLAALGTGALAIIAQALEFQLATINQAFEQQNRREYLIRIIAAMEAAIAAEGPEL